jgi:hypoxanthine-DNA glycosylase
MAAAADIAGFAPLAQASARVLILGSMPGKASLAAGQYYAHPRNAFWPILGELAGACPNLAYAERCQILTAKGIAVWDVLKSCRRPSSLDADIDKSSIIANDFAAFFANHPQLQQVYFNGATAEQSFRRHVGMALDLSHLRFQRLPSTSPAHAAMSYPQKLEVWRIIAVHLSVCGE